MTLGTLGSASNTKTWMMRLNADGCFGGIDCGEHNIYTSTLELAGDNSELKVYPNPSNDLINIELISKSVIKVELLNSAGQLQISDIGDDIRTLEVSQLNKGVYFLNVVANTNKLYAKRIVIKEP